MHDDFELRSRKSSVKQSYDDLKSIKSYEEMALNRTALQAEENEEESNSQVPIFPDFYYAHFVLVRLPHADHAGREAEAEPVGHLRRGPERTLPGNAARTSALPSVGRMDRQQVEGKPPEVILSLSDNSTPAERLPSQLAHIIC